MHDRGKIGYRSLFWPVILIGVGVLWLLANMNMMGDVHLSMLWRLWPLLLIGIGLDLLIGRRSQLLGAMVGLLIVGLAFGALVLGPTLGWSSQVEVITEQFNEPVGAAETAQVSLTLSVGPSRVEAGRDNSLLFEAEITHIGEIDFDVSGERAKRIRLRQIDRGLERRWTDWLDQRQLRWEVGLNPAVPVELSMDGGVGEAELDLRSMLLRDLRVNVGVGDIDLWLPAVADSYAVDIEGGVGNAMVYVESGSDLRMEIDGGVGDTTIELPSDAAVRVEAATGVGKIRIPDRFRRVSTEDDNPVGDQGVWETEGFASADRQIVIIFNGGVGNLVLR